MSLKAGPLPLDTIGMLHFIDFHRRFFWLTYVNLASSFGDSSHKLQLSAGNRPDGITSQAPVGDPRETPPPGRRHPWGRRPWTQVGHSVNSVNSVFM